MAAYPLPRERNAILALLLALALASWVLLLWQATLGPEQQMGLTMGMSAPLFLATWVVMMVAMMFPAAAPMILVFARIYAGRRQRGQAFVPTWVFVGAYLLVWTLFGALAYGLDTSAQALVEHSLGAPWLLDHAPRLGGAILVLAGLYQLLPLKRACLARCRSPLEFLLGSWRDGYAGALRLGLEHGAYCLGCCWHLFVLLFPLGVMNIAAMALLTLLIFAEKSLPLGERVSQLAALVLIGYGVLVVLVPAALPTFMPHEPAM
jgi:predicted metal-binding membrane protein